ncbi:hypothetical protein AKJ09_03416 [Labilithrix luteola]|uniref:AsmA-like C-terminal domain-containing protein n=1 Tax=Labilithrix luteola TaxID=1391654 RepID=A0A0K1PTB9_9BACT|nr:hypothetical protein [Labilithrix luteola]AKU96752.1 hypothetical protein AKJ09_03416 [Labilithrix luteola]
MAFFSLALFYVVAVNLFLSTPLFEAALGRDPDTIAIGLDRAWSILPGRVHCSNLVIRGRDSSLEWIVRIDEADVDIALLQLAKKRFAVSRVHARGSSFRMRKRLDFAPTPAEIAHIPPIEGLPPWSLRPKNIDHSNVWSDKAYHLWSIDLENVDAEDVREIWVDRERFEGHADVRGRFYLKPIRLVDVGPVHVAVHEGMVSTNGPAVISPIQGTVDVRIPPFDPRIAKGDTIARRLTLHTDLRGACSNMLYLMKPLPPDVRLEGFVDIPRLAVKIDAGELRTGTHVELHAPHTVLRNEGYRFDGKASLRADVEREALTPTLRFRLDTEDLEVKRRSTSGDELIVREPHAVVRGDATALVLTEFLRDLHAVADFPEADVPDMRTLDGFIPPDTPFRIERGQARAAVTLERWTAQNRTSGKARFTADDLDVTLAKLRMRGCVDAETTFTTHPKDRSLLEHVHAGVTLHDGSLASEHTPATPFMRTPELRVSAHAETLLLEDPLANLDVSVRMPEASVLDPHLLQAYSPGGQETSIAPGRGDFAMKADVSVADHLASGTLDVTANDLGFTYRDVDVTTVVRANARVHDWDWQRGDLALDDANVDITNIRAGKRGMPPSPLGSVLMHAQSPKFSFEHPREELSLSARARLPDARTLGLFLPPDSILTIESGSADLEANLDFSPRPPRTTGRIALDVSRGSIVLRDRTHASGDVHFKAIVSGEPVDHRFDVSGSRLVTSNALVTTPDSETKTWNTDVVLEKAILGTRPMGIDATVELNSKDAREIIAGIVRHAPPMIVRRLTMVPHFEAHARVSAGPSRIVVHELQAHGGDLAVHGLVGLRAEHHRGAFVIKKGFLSGGVRFDDAGAHARLFGLDHWMQGQTRDVINLVGAP